MGPESEGTTSEYEYSESWQCDGQDYSYTIYFSEGGGVPEASTLLLTASGLSALAGWVALRRRLRRG